jgi:hypothetical protein
VSTVDTTSIIKERFMRQRLGLCLLAAVSVAACGGGDNGNPAAPSAPQPFNQTVTGTVSSFGTTQHTVSIPRSGQMRLTLTWVGGGDLDLYLTNTACNSYPPTDCTMLASSDSATGASETILRPVNQGETYKAWVDSFIVSEARNYSMTITIQ